MFNESRPRRQEQIGHEHCMQAETSREDQEESGDTLPPQRYMSELIERAAVPATAS